MACRMARSVSPGREVRSPMPARSPVSPTRSRLESHLRSLSKLQAQIHIEAELGSGHCSKVLLGKDRSGQYVAVKAISLKTAKMLGIDERCLWGEVQVMREVLHPNLPRLMDAMVSWEPLPSVAAEPPFLCIVMEYIANSETLSHRIRQCRMPLQLVERVLVQLASALARLHRSDLVHRDVWVENILIDKDSSKVTLLDFGCVERVHKPMLNKKLNIPYISPEAAAGLPHDTAEDAWALGLLVTEMVTGRFVADRLGRVDRPIHSHPALAQALAETVQLTHDLGLLATQFLDAVPSRRPKMADVANILRGRNEDSTASRHPHRSVTAGSAGAPSEKRLRLRASGSSTSRLQSPLGFRGRLCQPSQRLSPARRNPNTLGPSVVDVSPGRGRSGRVFGPGHGTNAVSSPPLAGSRSQPMRSSLGRKDKAIRGASKDPPPPTFQQGQVVLYCPREAGVQKATVLGRSADGKGWQIQLESGPLRVVEDSEEWRLCLCDVPAPRPAPEGPVLAWAEAKPVKAQVLNNPSSGSVSSLATALTGSTTATEADSLLPKGQVVSKAYTVLTSPSPMRPTTRAAPMPCRTPGIPVVPGPSAGPVTFVTKSCSEAHLGPMLRARKPQLFAGQRLFYTARSNGQRYAGVITGFTPTGGYQIFLDCGERKIVEEHEAWRLSCG